MGKFILCSRHPSKTKTSPTFVEGINTQLNSKDWGRLTVESTRRAHANLIFGNRSFSVLIGYKSYRGLTETRLWAPSEKVLHVQAKPSLLCYYHTHST